MNMLIKRRKVGTQLPMTRERVPNWDRAKPTPFLELKSFERRRFLLPNTEERRAKSMNKQLRLRDGKIKTAYWSLVGVVAALLVSTQAVFAADMWDRFSMIMKDIYGELVAISTIVAVTVAAIALLVRMISRNQRAVDEATSWLKRIVITWIVLNSLGFIVAYLQPLISGGNYNP